MKQTIQTPLADHPAHARDFAASHQSLNTYHQESEILSHLVVRNQISSCAGMPSSMAFTFYEKGAH